MTSVLYSLSWEFARRVWPILLFVVALMVLLPLLIKNVILLSGVPLGQAVIRPLDFHFAYIFIGFLGAAGAILDAQADVRRRLYVLPVSTPFIVAWLMGAAAITIVLAHVITAALYAVVFGGRWPIAGPALFSAAAIVLAQCLHWSLLRFQFRRLLIAVAIILATIWWLYTRCHRGPLIGTGWQFVTTGEVATMTSLVAIAYVVGVRLVAQLRCGDTAVETWWRSMVEKAMHWLLGFFYAEPDDLRDGTAAVRWLQWTWLGPYPICIGAGVSLYVLATQYDAFGKLQLGEAGTSFILGSAFAATLISLTHAVDGPHTVGAGMSPFLSAKPISNVALSSALLRSLARTTVIAWLILVVVSLLHASIWIVWDEPVRTGILDAGPAAIPLLLVSSLIVAWTTAGVIASFVWTGRRRLNLIVFVGIQVSIILFAILIHLIHEDYQQTIRGLAVGACAVLVAAATIAVFAAALRLRLLGYKTLTLAAVFWAVEVACCWWLLPRAAALGIALPGFLALTIAPLALAPLAITWNRHR